MKSTIIAIFFLISTSAFAHIEPGTWVGKTDSGEICRFVAGKAYFEPAQPHPLNERIQLQMGNDIFVLRHPAVLDVNTSTVSFDHDHFHAILSTASGAKALVIDMVHTAAFEGPSAFHLIENDWKADKKTKVNCLNLQHVNI